MTRCEGCGRPIARCTEPPHRCALCEVEAIDPAGDMHTDYPQDRLDVLPDVLPAP